MDTPIEKNIFLLWLQGWDQAPWLQKQVAESWEINNKEDGWTIHYIDNTNLRKYVNDIDYIYDSTKQISMQALSDIIRLSLLKNHGGVWADSTMLCMQPLEHWVHEAVSKSEMWMYHGHGAKMEKEVGPASWFIVSKKNSYVISQWKKACDQFWMQNNYTNNYFWLDGLFKDLFEKDILFRTLWLKAPYLYCELDGQSHTLAHHGMTTNTLHIKQLFWEKPPYTLKLWNAFTQAFPDVTTPQCIKSNAYWVIQMSRRKFTYKWKMD
jgi:Capsular polysaccharide synthesis protein